MTLKQALSHAREALAAHNIEEAPLESELLLRHALKLNRVSLYLNLEKELEPPEEEIFRQLVERRLSGEPTAYITEHCEFYGIDFYVNRNVLIPRPESELLVEKTLALARNGAIDRIADIGTGCGAIAISLALNLPHVRIYATDISSSALEVAGMNCQRYGLENRIQLLQGDMLEPLPEPVKLIVANPPYVRRKEISQLTFEPPLALDGGADGLDKIRKLCRQLKDKLQPGGCLLLEIGQGQGKAVIELLRQLFPPAKIEVTSDFAGIDRVVSLETAHEVLLAPG